MRDAVIVDKGNPEERMAGAAISQIRRDDGFVLTLYRGPSHPFIHALSSADAWALCIDLPGSAGGGGDGALDWGLAQDARGNAVFAVNATLGIAIDVDPHDLSVRRTATIATAATPRFTLAKFGHADVGPVGRRVVVTPDGSRILAAGRDGIAVIATSDLAVARRDLGGTPIEALAITPDGSTVFALAAGDGRIAAIETATGRLLGWVPGSGFDRLVAVAPW
jgi:hypothetical protein